MYLGVLYSTCIYSTVVLFCVHYMHSRQAEKHPATVGIEARTFALLAQCSVHKGFYPENNKFLWKLLSSGYIIMT